MKQFFYVPDTQGKVSNNEREELVRELRRELGLGGGGGGGRGKSLQVPWQLETGIHFGGGELDFLHKYAYVRIYKSK